MERRVARYVLKRLVLVALLVAALVFGAATAFLLVTSRDLPDLSSLDDYHPPVTSRVYDQAGNLVARFYEERRTVVPIERVPKHVKAAFIAAEDEAFYQHE